MVDTVVEDKVSFFHWINETKKHKNLKAVTFAYTFIGNDLVFAISRCDKLDQFSRRKGRTIAEGRLQLAIPYYKSGDYNLFRECIVNMTERLHIDDEPALRYDTAHRMRLPSEALAEFAQVVFD